MSHAALARVMLLAVAILPVVRATCDTSCLHIPEPAPPPCHDKAPDAPGDECSHDHERIVARLAAPSIALEAVMQPAVVMPTIGLPPIDVHVTGEGTPLVPRAGPQAVLRV